MAIRSTYTSQKLRLSSEHPITLLFRQAIAALSKAMAADPNNAEVLLSLGVSYTNELDQGRALNFLTAWLSRQPAFAKARAPASIWPSPEASYGVPLRAAAIRRLALESLLQRACHGESFEEAFMHGPCLLSQPLLRLRLTRRCCRRCFRKPGRSRTPVSACPTR